MSGSRHIWRRHWILTAALLILVSAGTAEAAAKLPRVYQSGSSVVLLASRSASRLNGGNPYLSFGPSLTLAADVLSTALMAPQTAHSLAARGFRSSYTVGLATDTTTTTGSVLLITVTGDNRTAVEHTLVGVNAEVGAKLAQLQNRVRPYDRIRATTLSVAPRPALNASSTARPLVSVVALGLLVAFGIPVIVDGQLTRRRLRRSSARPVSTPVPGDQIASPATGEPQLPAGELASGTQRQRRSPGSDRARQLTGSLAVRQAGHAASATPVC